MAALIPIFNANRRLHRAPRVFRERPDILGSYRDCEIISRYRLDRQSILYLENLLMDDLCSTTRRSFPVSTLTQILVGLRYFAKGDFLSEVTDLHEISKATGARLLNHFIDAVNRRVDTIRFPTSRVQLEQMQLGFFQRAGISQVVGAIDGTLIPIIAPILNEDVYVCRKGFHAINVQAVVGYDMRFTDVVAKWPGSQHDAAIWNTCALKNYIENNRIGHLLGDSGYALRQYLLTPISNPQTNAERTFNTKHCQTRVIVEKAFGLLKSRFRCLHRSGGCLPFQPAKCCKVVTACMRLNNLCINNNVPIPDMCLQNNNICDDRVIAGDQRVLDRGARREREAGLAARQDIVNTFN